MSSVAQTKLDNQILSFFLLAMQNQRPILIVNYLFYLIHTERRGRFPPGEGGIFQARREAT